MFIKSKKAQELSMGGAIMGIVGAGIGFFISKQMQAGIFLSLMSTVVTGVVCYFMASFILNK